MAYRSKEQEYQRNTCTGINYFLEILLTELVTLGWNQIINTDIAFKNCNNVLMLTVLLFFPDEYVVSQDVYENLATLIQKSFTTIDSKGWNISGVNTQQRGVEINFSDASVLALMGSIKPIFVASSYPNTPGYSKTTV